jgi:O-methyltransferase
MKKEIELLKRSILGISPAELKEKYLQKQLTEEDIEKIINVQINKDRYCGGDWPKDAESMIGYLRMTNLQDCLIDLNERKIEGDVIETGVWKGGAVIFMKGVLDLLNANKKVFVADSFSGLPKPNGDKYPKDSNDIHHTFSELSISEDEVKKNFIKYNLLDDKVIFLKGWFKDTLSKIEENQKFCLIRLDGDMYESTMDSITNLYPKLNPGGYIIVDDFCLQPCVDAVMDYRKLNNITAPINKVDHTGVYWIKE